MARRVAIVLMALALLASACGGSPAPAPPQPGSPPAPGQVDRVQVFLVALNDGGRSGKAIGCGDSLVAVQWPVKPTSSPMRAALEELLSLPGPTVPASGLYNALYRSHLSIQRLSLENGQASVDLVGETRLGGVCDDPRFVAQIDATVRQFPTVKNAAITVNGRPLADFLSEKG